MKKNNNNYKYLLWAIPIILQPFMWGILQQIPAKYNVYSKLDDIIPFCKYFVIPYISWFVFYAGSMIYFLIKTKEEFVDTCKQMIIGLVISWIIFIFFQNQITFRPETTLQVNDIFTWMISIIYKSGNTVCACPSLHCYISGVLCCSWVRYTKLKKPKITKILIVILTVLIWLSTVFIKQHSIIDILGAAVVLFISYIITYKIIKKTA